MNRLRQLSGRGMRVIGITVCALLLLLFACLSCSASRGKCATYDEPLHAVGGYVHRTMADFRINQEDPALFGYWASLAHLGQSFKLNTDYVYWDRMIQDFNTNQWWFVWLTLYKTQGNDGAAFVQQSRFMFVLVGMALGAVIAWWSWKLAGLWAGIFATALFALDPNFLAHSALVKNDVMLSLMMAAMAMALWWFGRTGGWVALACLALSSAAAVNTKYSGVLSGPIILIGLLYRGILPQPWRVLGIELDALWKRLLVAPAACVVVGLTCYVGIWACYGFRFSPTPDPNQKMDVKRIVDLLRSNKYRATLSPGDVVSQEAFDKIKPGFLADTIVWADSKHLLPQAWLHGFLYTYSSTLVRSSFLMGEVSTTGWWYYFPCTMIFKTPTATLIACLLAAATAFVTAVFREHLARFDQRRGTGSLLRRVDSWALVSLCLPVLVYMASAMSTNLNLGLRHILPVYPFIFVAVAIVLGGIIERARIVGFIAGGVVLLGLFAESVAAYPNYIPFFNAPSGGRRGGFELLGDSNLDWGQDLMLLAEWQKSHMDKPLYLAYFGIADPEFHGVKVAAHLPFAAGGFPFDPNQGAPDRYTRCYFAVSATTLQGVYVSPQVADFYRDLRERRNSAVAVLGGTIYVFEFPLPPSSQRP